jgi:hypothetical protein
MSFDKGPDLVRKECLGHGVGSGSEHTRHVNAQAATTFVVRKCRLYLYVRNRPEERSVAIPLLVTSFLHLLDTLADSGKLMKYVIKVAGDVVCL